jgi:type I restriction enzyme, S subunit
VIEEQHELPQGWITARLGGIAPSGGTRNLEIYSDGEFFYVDIEAVNNIAQKIVAPKRISTAKAPSRARMAIQAGDVIFSLVRPYLKNIAIVPKELDGQVASTAYCVMRPEQGILSSFVFYSVLREEFINLIATYGNSPPSGHDDEFLAMSIPLAPTNEQRRIVAAIEQHFTRLDAGIAALRRAQTKLKRYRAVILKAAVEGKLTEAWRAEHPATESASQLLERILKERHAKWETDLRAKGKDPAKVKYVEPAAPDMKNLPTLSKGWCWVTVEQVSHFVRYGSSTKTSDDASGIPVLRMGNIQDGSLDLGNLKYLPTNHPEFPTLLLENGDLLFNRTNSAELVGKSAVYHGNPSPCSYASYLIDVRMVTGCSADYVCFFLNSSYGRAWVKSVVSQQVGQANVNGSKLQALAFPLPPLAEQEQIVAEVQQRLSIVSELEATVEANLKRAERLRQSILHEAFSGRLVLQDPNDEPASILLERIRRERDGHKNGASNKKHSLRAPEPVKLDVTGAEQLEFWESVGN